MGIWRTRGSLCTATFDCQVPRCARNDSVNTREFRIHRPSQLHFRSSSLEVQLSSSSVEPHSKSPPPPMRSFEILSLDQYRSVFPDLAHALGRADAITSGDEALFLAKITTLDPYPSGAISPADVFFLTAVASILAPRMAFEIGTASGFSAAVLAAAFARGYRQRGEKIDGPLFHTIDRKEQWLADSSKKTGFLISHLVPELSAHVAVHTLRDSEHVRELAKKNEVALCFIDGNHQHPLPLIDVMNLLPVVRGDGWFLLHDIKLPERAAARGDPSKARRGAQYVFDAWPFAKIDGGNIGAVQVPADKTRLLPFAHALLGKPLETPPESSEHYRRRVLELIEEWK
jgi:hypothetical protein